MSDRVEYILSLRDLFSDKLDKAGGAVKRFDGNAKSAQGGIGGLGRAAVTAFALIGGAAAALDIIKTTAKFQAMDNAIRFASGKEGERNLAFLKERSDTLGLSLEASKEGFKTLSGAMIGSKLAGQGTREIFDSVAQAGTVMGLTADDQKGTFLALGQMMGKGKVQAEELRGQLGERIPGAFQIAARAMKMTTAELDKMMQNGNLIAEDFLPKFAAELKKTFGPGVATAAQSLQANMNRFENTMTEMKLSIGNAIMPVVNDFLQGFSKVFNWVRTNFTSLKRVFAPVIDALRPIVNVVRDLAEKLGAANGEASILEKIFNVIGNVLLFIKPALAEIGELLGEAINFFVKIGIAIGDFIQRHEFVQKVLVGFGTAVVGVFRTIAKAAKDILGGVGDLIAGIFNMDASQIGNGLSQLKDALGAANPRSVMSSVANDFVGGYQKGYTSVDFFDDPKAAPKGGSLKDKYASDRTKDAANILGTTPGGKGAGRSSALGSAVGEVSGGRPTTVNIQIDKLIEQQIFNTTNLMESAQKIKEEVSKVLLGVVNDVNLIITG